MVAEEEKKSDSLYSPSRRSRDWSGRDPNFSDIGGARVRNTFSKATIIAGKPVVWLSVFCPYDQGQNKAQVASGIKTMVDQNDNISVRIDDTTVSITQNGEWSVKRK